MRTKSFGFIEADIAHIDNVIDALHELDLHKTRAKDTLETETIKCAAVRHKLMQYPDEINREIHEAVQSARIVNEEAIGRIKTQLEQLSRELSNIDEQTAGVDAENDSMSPNLAVMKAEFDGHFAKLNDLLAEKSAEQIRLNEDRETVRWASARIVELEEDAVRLAELMAAEREAHSNTMRRLQGETNVVAQQLHESTKKESKIGHEFLIVHLAQEQLTGQLEEAVQLHENLEHEIVTLQVREQDSRRLQAQQQKSNERLKKNIETLAAESKSAVDEHQMRMVEMKATVEALDARIQQQTALKEQFVAKKSEVKVRTETLKLKEEVDEQKVQDVSQALQKARQDLTGRTDDLDRMRQEIIDLESRRTELEDAKRAEKEGWLNPSELLESNTVLGYNKQIAELKESLERKRGDRMEIQATCERLQASIREFNAEEIAQTKAINDQMDSLKHEKISLDEEQRRILAQIKADEARREGLAERLAAGRRQLAETQRAKTAEAERLLSETGRLAEAKAAKSAELAKLEPKFAEFRGFFDRGVAEYEALKRSLATLKSRKSGLEEASRRTGEEVGRLAGDIAGLRRDKERRVAQSASQLDEMAGDRVRVESEIYVLACKLGTVQMENARLEAGVDRLEREMRAMRDTWEAAVPAKARADQQRAREARDLQTGRLRDAAAGAEFQEDAERLLAALSAIVSDTEARRVILEAVTDSLDAELGYLDEQLKTSADQSE